jgi:hypothetical protein
LFLGTGAFCIRLLRAFLVTNPPTGRKTVPDQRDARFSSTWHV